MIQADGWTLDRVVGSHRQFRHPTRPARSPSPATSAEI
ncbi:MAG: type II toxin-antitoxin system HicA family toxin [Candidatus Dormibacteria bacterium]